MCVEQDKTERTEILNFFASLGPVVWSVIYWRRAESGANPISDLALVEIDEQPYRNIWQFHIAQ